jgi:hypothetical protein
MARILRSKIQIEQEVILEPDSDEAISSDSESELDNTTLWLQVITIMQVKAKIKFGRVHNTLGILVVSILSLDISVDKIQEAPHVNKDSSPVTIIFLFFMDVIQLLTSRLISTITNMQTHLTMMRCSRFPDVAI